MPATVAHNHNPRLVLMDGSATGFAIYEGNKRLAEYVAPTGLVTGQDIETLRTQHYPPAKAPTKGKDAA
jgi:hypothetical protein